MSLRWRWALSLGLVAALAIGLTTLAAILSAERQLRGAVDQDLRERVAEVRRWSGTLLDEGRGEARYLLPRIIDFDAVVQAFEADGTVVLRIGREGVAPPIEPVDLSVLSGDRRTLMRDVRIGNIAHRMITVGVQIHRDGDPDLLAFQVATDLSGVEANLAALTRRLFVIGVIGVLLVGLTGWILASRAVRPITDLTEVAEHVAATERLDAGRRLDDSAPGEIGRLAGAFSSMLASLAASRQEQQRLVSDAGHEFRTPITALKTNLEILRRQGERLSAGQRDELIDAALGESNQLADLAGELVDLASDVQHADERVEEIDLGMLATAVADRYRQLGAKRITVSGVGATVDGRRSQLERAMGNLVDNAVKWAGTEIEISVQDGRVTVRDDGPGIPDADIPHIFRRFYRSEAARSTSGSGLGLAIVEHLVAAHGGTVFARNAPGDGAEVGFILPLVPKDS